MEGHTTITPKTIGGLVRVLSGIFITKENPLGLTPKECVVLSVLRVYLQNKDDVITKDIKIKVSNDLNQTLQVTTNYVNKFKKKGAITANNRLHPLFFTTKLTIDGTHILQRDSTEGSVA